MSPDQSQRSQNGHHRKGTSNYTLVLVPDDQSKRTKSFSIGGWGIAWLSASLLAVVIGSTLAIVIYTPFGSMLPIVNPDLENRYGKQIVSIQEQVNHVLDELVHLRAYNLRLRKALGERISAEDSTTMIHDGVDRLLSPREALGDTAIRDVSSYRTGFREIMPEDSRIHGQNLKPEDTPDTAELFPLLTPTIGYYTRGFDPNNGHYGIDLAGKEGTLIVATAPGKVIFSDWTYRDGFKIILAHTQGFVSVYKHNRTLLKQFGTEVKRGESIALMGTTGQSSSASHLHFELWKDGVALDPVNYLITVQ